MKEWYEGSQSAFEVARDALRYNISQIRSGADPIPQLENLAELFDKWAKEDAERVKKVSA